MSDKKLKVGIIGMGTIGAIHADAYQASGDVEVAAVCDVDAARMKSEAQRLGVADCFADYKDLLKSDVDAVSVCVGNALHRDVAIEALEAGKHVLLEKPMALNASQATEIVDASKKAEGILQIGMVRRQAPEAQVLREYVEAGHLGEIYHIRAVLVRRRGIPGLGGWFTTMAQSGGGPMIDLGVHWFDMSMWMSDLWEPTSVSAKTYAKFGAKMEEYVYVGMWAGPPRLDGTFDVEDYSAGFVRFDSKATMSFEIAWAANTEGGSYIEFLGDKGGARLFGGPLKVYTEHNGRLADITPHFDGKVNSFTTQASKFAAACRGEIEPVATGEQGLTVMKLIDSIYESGKQNAEVQID